MTLKVVNLIYALSPEHKFCKKNVLKNHFMPKPFHHLRFDMTKIKLKDDLLLPAGKNKILLECLFLSMMRLLPVNMLVCVWLVFFALTWLLSDCLHPLNFQVLDSSFEMTLKVALPLQSSCLCIYLAPGHSSLTLDYRSTCPAGHPISFAHLDYN